MTYTFARPYNASNWIEQFFTDLDRGFGTAAPTNSFVPAVDVVENNDAYVLRA